MKHINLVKSKLFVSGVNQWIALTFIMFVSFSIKAQTNVFDAIIAQSPAHTYLKAALEQEGLDAALKNPSATLTVFAPTNDAFDSLASALGTDISGILARTDLSNILLYHVLGTQVASSGVSNGAVVAPLSDSNTLKLTKTAASEVFVNQAKVSTADLTADNGVVHVIDGVLLPVKTVVDIALDAGFTTLATAVITAELLPALSDPLAKYTVFAPNNAAFDTVVARLGTDLNGLLALPILKDILLYHVLGTEVLSSAIGNGDLAATLNGTNTIKLTVNASSEVFANQSKVISADATAANGVVHVLEEVVLPGKTVADVAIDNGFSTLVAAVVKAGLLPALSNPFASFTVFAPDNNAFSALAMGLNTTVEGLLDLPNLSTILLYHVIGEELNSSDLQAGDLSTLNGKSVNISLDGGVKVNEATVTLADVEGINGVVHVINTVLVPGTSSVETLLQTELLNFYPNPAQNQLRLEIDGLYQGALFNQTGLKVMEWTSNVQVIDLSTLSSGMYLIRAEQNGRAFQGRFIKQ
jgi:uncharacterized surface protein with fasciclin (FAS1) repeats